VAGLGQVEGAAKTRESRLSYWIRRRSGIASAVSIRVALVCVLIGFQTIALAGFLNAWMLPFAIMIVHLAVTRVLSREGRQNGETSCSRGGMTH
jgi:hypothetical protein